MQNEKLKIKNVLLGVVVAAASVHAQAPDFSGTWRLDESKSRVVATAGIIGLIPAGAPKTLHITHPANGTVVIESQINEAHVRIYKPGRETSTPAGQGGAVTMTARWEGKSLISEGAQKAPNGDTTTIREAVSVSADGKVLTMEVTTSAFAKASSASAKASAFAGATADRSVDREASSTLVYTKITDVGACETWPTPCKRPQK
jgi:hypothetical protein